MLNKKLLRARQRGWSRKPTADQPLLRCHDTTWHRLGSAVFALLACFLAAQPALAHEVFVVAATGPAGGELRLARFTERQIQVFEVLCQEKECLYSSSNPGFAGDPAHGELSEADLAAEGLFPLGQDVPVWLEVTDIPPEVKIGFGRVMIELGKVSQVWLGTGLELHNHPSWRLILPRGTSGAFRVVFRLTSTTSGYLPSPAYTVWVTNQVPQATATPTDTPSPPATPSTAYSPTPTPTVPLTFTATPSPSPSEVASPLPTDTPITPPTQTETPAMPSPTKTPETQPTPSACPGDCNGDGQVTIEEIIVGVSIALESDFINRCPSLDHDGDQLVTIEELIRAVNAALLGCT